MLAIDPDIAPDEAESPEDEHKPEEIGGAPEWYLDTFDPLEPDVAEVTSIAAQPTPVEDSELVARGRAPPAWRRRFPCCRSCSTLGQHSSLQPSSSRQGTNGMALAEQENEGRAS